MRMSSSFFFCVQECPLPDPSELFTNVYVNDCGLEVSTDVDGV